MKVWLFPADTTASGYYRMGLPAHYVSKSGIETVMSPKLNGYWDSGRLVGVEPLDTDVVVFQRPMHRDVLDAIPHIQKQGIAVVIDLDDDYSCIPPESPSFREHHPTYHPESNWDHLKNAVRSCDIATVATPALAKRYGTTKSLVIRNALDPQVVNKKYAETLPRTIGWAGTVSNHPKDLVVTRGGVAQAIEKYGWSTYILGGVEKVQTQLGLSQEPACSGWLSYDKYMYELGNLAVGIVPLAHTKFNEAKSFLKGIEYASRGIPFVASPLPEYLYLVDQGIGITANDRGRDWLRQLSLLLESESYLSEQASSQLDLMQKYHLITHRVDQWASAWKTALDKRRA